MRTTVDLPAAVHRRASDLARSQDRSLSSVVAELTARALADLDEPLTVTIDRRTGFPVVHLDHRITSDDVADALAEE